MDYVSKAGLCDGMTVSLTTIRDATGAVGEN